MISQGKQNKRVVFAFSDPAGAKALIAYYLQKKDILEKALLVSNRSYPFYEDMGVKVQLTDSEGIKALLDDFVPNWICTGTSSPEQIELSCIKYGNNYPDINTSSFVDHWTNMKLRFLSNGELILPDIVYTIDEKAKQEAVKDSIPKERLKVMENPYYKYLETWNPKVSRTQFLKQLSLPKSSKFVLYAPEPFSTFGLEEKYGFSEIDGLLRLSKLLFSSYNDLVYLVIKCHPNQNIENLNRSIEYLPVTWRDRIRIIEEGDLNEFFYYSEYTVGHFSNSMVEAARMKKKVIRMLVGIKKKELDPLSHLNIGMTVYNDKEMLKAINI